MRKFGLIGYPLGHSFSKKYFTEKFSRENLTDCSYELYPLESIDLFPSLLKNETSLRGLNVTIPYKSAVIRFLDSTSDEASAIGAVNVIKIHRENGKMLLSGFNSDVTGFHDSVMPFLDKKRGNAIVLGTGGSSKAVRFALEKIGMHIISISRTRGKEAIAYEDLDKELIRSSTLIVNTTPLGMFPDTDSKPPIDYDALTKDQILYDLVYNPEKTSFLREGEKRGCRVVSGLKMLHLQAERSWEIWNDENL
jgi:shikimate dehydrogenase